MDIDYEKKEMKLDQVGNPLGKLADYCCLTGFANFSQALLVGRLASTMTSRLSQRTS